MRIAHVIESLDPRGGGPPKIAASIAAAQARLGHEVRLISEVLPGRERDTRTMLDVVPGFELVERVDLSRQRAWRWFGSRSVRADLAGQLRDVEMIHLHSVWEPLLLATSWAARGLDIPYTVLLNGMLDPWSLSQRRWKKRLALALAYRDMLNRAAFLHVGNRDERFLIESLGLRASAEVVPNGVDLREIDAAASRQGAFRQSCPALGDRPYFLFLSRLHYKKGLDILAEAYARFVEQGGEADLVVAGPDGGAQADFQHRVHRYGLRSRVHLVGPIYGPEKYDGLRGALAFVLPSRQEGFSVAITEALACGRPVAVTENCHFPEVAEVKAGLITPLDHVAFCQAMLQLDRAPDAAERMGRAARQLVEQRYQWTRIGARLIELYTQAGAAAAAEV